MGTVKRANTMRKRALAMALALLALVCVVCISADMRVAYADDGAADGAADGTTLTVKEERVTALENGKTYLFAPTVTSDGKYQAMKASATTSSGYDALRVANFAVSGTTATFDSADDVELCEWKAIVNPSSPGQFQLVNGNAGLTRYYGHLRMTSTEDSWHYFTYVSGKLQDADSEESGDSYNRIMFHGSAIHGWNGNGSCYDLGWVYEVVKAADSYIVNFDSEGGSAVDCQTVAAGGLVTRPDNPMRENYTFAGWFKDSACTQEWNFETDVVNEIITLHAKWESATGESTTVNVQRVLSMTEGNTYIIVDDDAERALSSDVAQQAAQYGNARDGKSVTWSSDGSRVTFSSLEDKATCLWTSEAADEVGHVKLKNGESYLGSKYAALHWPAETTVEEVVDSDGNATGETITTITDNLGFSIVDNDYILTDDSSDLTKYWLSYDSSVFKGFRPNTGKSKAYVYLVLPEGETHVHSIVKVAGVDSTCTTKGTEEYWKCATCGEMFADEAATTRITEPVKKEALGHDWGPWIADDSLTHTRTCLRDGDHHESAPHSWDKGVITKPATADEEGVMTYTCADCNATYTAVIAKTTGNCTGSGDPAFLVEVQKATALEAGKTYVVLSADTSKVMTSENVATQFGGSKLAAADVAYRAAENRVAFTSSVDYANAAWTCGGSEGSFTFSQSSGMLYGNWAYIWCGDANDFAGGGTTSNMFGYEYDADADSGALYESGAASYKIGFIADDAVFGAAPGASCVLCEVTNVIGLIASTSHDLQLTAAKEPTCTEAGNTAYYTCTKCGKHYADEAAVQEITDLSSTVLDPTNHVLDAVESSEPTCEKAGNSAYWHCAKCDCYFADAAASMAIEKDSWIIAALGHEWDEGTVTTPATCDTPGVRTFTCAHDAGHTRTEEIPALGHKFVPVESVDATCTEDGYTLYRCRVCGVTEKRNIVKSADAHTYGAWQKVDDKTHMRTCTTCRNAVQTAPHIWDSGTVTKAAAVGVAGTRTYTCIACGATKVEQIAALTSAKKAQKLKVTKKIKVVKASKVARKAVKVKKALKVKGAKTALAYKIVKVKKAKATKKQSKKAAKKFKIKKSGLIVAKKGLAKGVYKLKVKVTAKESSAYKEATKTVTLKIKVK